MMLSQYDWRIEAGRCTTFLGAVSVQPSWIERVISAQGGGCLDSNPEGGDNPRSCFRLDSRTRWRAGDEGQTSVARENRAQEGVV